MEMYCCPRLEMFEDDDEEECYTSLSHIGARMLVVFPIAHVGVPLFMGIYTYIHQRCSKKCKELPLSTAVDHTVLRRCRNASEDRSGA